jgi:putative tryptophan/tyrosine transport system substrate-binding protein
MAFGPMVSWWLSRRLTAESRCAYLDFEGYWARRDGLIPTRFRKIQVYPKDLRALPGHPELAVSWSGRFREGSRMLDLRRRDFIALLGCTAAAWPLAARAQQADQRRHIGVLTGLADDPENRARLAAFRYGLEKRGWSEGRNVLIDYRFAAAASPDQVQLFAKELVALRPDVIFAQTTPVVNALQRETRAIPIVFAAIADPIGSGFIASLPHPGGNITGVMLYEPSVTGKWLSMLKEIAPQLVRAAFIVNPTSAPFYDYYLRAAEPLSRSLGIDLVPTLVADTAEIERAIEVFASAPNGGLVLPPDATTTTHRDLIVALAARHHLPAVYTIRPFVTAGGLMSYGVDFTDMFRQAASYVDRILRGDNPADLPVQAATKFETIINLKTAKALGFTVPPGLLVAADEVIE